MTEVRRAGVLGSPISHSLSPTLHRAAYAALGLHWRYDAHDVTEEQLAAFLDSCGADWAGLSLTMPLKAAVLPFLRDASEVVRLAGAANTVLFTEHGLIGDNTDVAGMRRSLSEASGETDMRIASATILGGGATARSALVAVASMGATDVHLGLRSLSRAGELEHVADALKVRLHPHAWAEAGRHLDTDVVISTVPTGASDDVADRVPSAPGVLLDVAYGAGPTALVRAWTASGAPAADGLDLLLWQAVDQVRLMTGQTAPVEAMRTALDAATRER